MAQSHCFHRKESIYLMCTIPLTILVLDAHNWGRLYTILSSCWIFKMRKLKWKQVRKEGQHQRWEITDHNLGTKNSGLGLWSQRLGLAIGRGRGNLTASKSARHKTVRVKPEGLGNLYDQASFCRGFLLSCLPLILFAVWGAPEVTGNGVTVWVAHDWGNCVHNCSAHN